MSNLLELQNLHVSYRTPRGTVQAVRGGARPLQPGEVLAIVGESGCGTSALCKAIMRLLPDNAGIEGKILVNGTDIAPYPEKELQKLRGRLFSMVFQDPMTALNPSMTIGAQIAEALSGARLLVWLGRAMAGESAPALVWSLLVTLAPFGLVSWLLGRSFTRIVTTKRGLPKVRYEEKALRTASADTALL